MASHVSSDHTVDDHNAWRLDSPGANGWKRTARADDPNKFFIVSADCHVQEPNDLWVQRMPKDLHHRLPGVSVDPKGEKFQKTEGFRPIRIRDVPFEGEDRLRNQSGKTPEERLKRPRRRRRRLRSAVPEQGPCHVGNARRRSSARRCAACTTTGRGRLFGPYNDRLVPMACVATGDIDGAIAEIQRARETRLQRPVAAVQAGVGRAEPRRPQLQPARVRSAVGLHRGRRSADHVPRIDRSRSAHRARQRRRDHQLRRALAGADHGADRQHLRVRRARASSRSCGSVPIEAGIGWVPWALTAMDEAYRKHHMWVRPKLELLPSEYFHRARLRHLPGGHAGPRSRSGARAGRQLHVGQRLTRTTRAPGRTRRQAIERTMGDLDDGERAKILGLNCRPHLQARRSPRAT